MKGLTIGQIAEAVQGDLLAGRETAVVRNICTDSRLAAEGDLFIPLIGERYDAHRFIPQALEKGCNSLLVSGKSFAEAGPSANIIAVKDTTAALQELAAYYLNLLSIKKIGVTGSTGKTSTKDLLYHVCSGTYKCGKNAGNFNNLIGVPLTILSLEEGTEVGIFEMGMDHPGEIDKLAEMIRPDMGIITNIGMAHIENLGSRENIFRAKMEITNYFRRSDTLIINQGGEFLTKENTAGDYRLVTVGTDGRSDYIISHIDDLGAQGIKFTLEYHGETEQFQLPVPGRHNAFNAALAVAAGAQLGISMKDAAAGLAKAELTDNRLSVMGKNGIKVIDDTYNASPDSMKSAIDVLMQTKGLRKVAILGDMLELGEFSRQQHELVGQYAAQQGVDVLIAIGPLAGFFLEGARGFPENAVFYFKKKKDFLKDMTRIIGQGDVILVKGSRGMAMEEIVKKIME